MGRMGNIMKGMCDMCGRDSDNIQAMLYNNDENKMLCPLCWDHEATRADMEYDRMREEGYNAKQE